MTTPSSEDRSGSSQRPEQPPSPPEPRVLSPGAPSGPSIAGEVINQLVPALVRLARGPGLVLLAVASIGLILFATVSIFLGLGSESWASWIPAAIAAFFAVPVGVFGLRRARLHRRTRGLHRTVRSGVTVLVRRSGGTDQNAGGGPLDGLDPQRERDHYEAARTELRRREARFLPRLEAAQRAARALAGGDAHAPYLKDDIRGTLAALLGTVVAVPVTLVGTVIVAIVLAVRSAPI